MNQRSIRRHIVTPVSFIALLAMGLIVWLESRHEDFDSLPQRDLRTQTVTGWLAFGEMRGYIEPCGCNPLTDLGGLRRLGAFFQKMKQLHPDSSLYNLGNNLPEDSSSEVMKARFLVEGLARINSTASLFNWLEILHHQSLAQHFEEAKGPYVLSNGKMNWPFVSELIVTDTEVVAGIVEPLEPSQHAHLRLIDRKLVRRLVELIEPHTDKDWVLLYAGSDTGLTTVLESIGFDRVVLASQWPLGKVVDHQEKLKPELLVRRVADNPHLAVPVGGQGVLRGGDLQRKRSIQVSDLSARRELCGLDNMSALCSTNGDEGEGLLVPADRELVTWMDRGHEQGHPFEEFFERYNSAATDDFEARISERLVQLASSEYVGAQACEVCHTAAYNSWSESSHAKAYPTLESIGKDTDPSCVSCHVVGFQKTGGFVSLQHSPHLANVQCENCHGPRRDHIDNPLQHQRPIDHAKTVCVECHHGSHSPEFNFDAYWPKIAHGK